jgi:Helix-turn-helix domain
MSRQAAEVGPPESEYLTVPETAKILRRNRKTVYGWIVAGGIREVDGLFVVQGRYLIHWPTFRSRQFKPRTKLRGTQPEYSEESQRGMAGKGQARPPENRL